MEIYVPAFQSRQPYFIPAVRTKRYDGMYRWHAFKGNPRYSADGNFNGYVGVGLDVHEQKNTEEKLEALVNERTKELAEANNTLQKINQELKRSNQNLEEFAHAASHDLKEPVRKIHFFTHQLKEKLSTYLKDEEIRSFNRIESATDRMRNLIDDLLLYSHVSQRPHEMESIDLAQKVQNVLEDLELDIEEKKAQINIEKLPIVNGYRRQLQQLFQNLISNALKYSKKDVPSRIDITAGKVIENQKPYHLIAVKDNGIGFAPEYAEKIFQMFTRLHGKAEYGGTGVGLSIVKKVVENHNGYIRAKSKPGEGSTFEIYLPV
jgi:light-regulated signal transduction histidine kinase (bacteriophytochrome)